MQKYATQIVKDYFKFLSFFFFLLLLLLAFSSVSRFTFLFPSETLKISPFRWSFFLMNFHFTSSRETAFLPKYISPSPRSFLEDLAQITGQYFFGVQRFYRNTIGVYEHSSVRRHWIVCDTHFSNVYVWLKLTMLANTRKSKILEIPLLKSLQSH